MAKQTQNVVMQGTSGKIGKTLVFRQMADGETIIAMRPRRKAPATPAELAEREKFREAAYIAKIRAKDHVLGPQYLARAKRGQGAYHVALIEYLNENKPNTSHPNPLTQKTYIEIAKLNLLATKNLLATQQAAIFVQNILNTNQKHNTSAKKRQENTVAPSRIAKTIPSPQTIAQNDKIPRSLDASKRQNT